MSAIQKIIKRDGRVVPFDASRIKNAIRKAALSVGIEDPDIAEKLASKVITLLGKKFKDSTPNVEEVQDEIVLVLRSSDLPEVAEAYSKYREIRSEAREAKKFVGVEDELKLSPNALSVLKKRYLIKDEKGDVCETPAELFARVAHAVSLADKRYGGDPKKCGQQFFEMMSSLEFLPNSPTLMNAGTTLGQLSACFVLPVEDSVQSIFETMKDMALIHQSGGGTGFSFSSLRPKGDVVRTTHGVASGPVSFMTIFDQATDVIKQGGRRRGANMGILSIDHPDILEFITSKQEAGTFSNFNISVSAPDRFFRSLARDSDYPLINPRTGEVYERHKAKEIFDLIVTLAWETGDPGLIFIDEINRKNPTPKIGKIFSTNPCGEQPLLPYESCNLGSINLTKFVDKEKMSWPRLRDTIKKAIHFLDNVIDVNKYPLPQIAKLTRANRKIGLGVMGFAETLILLNIPYDSSEALKFAEKLMKFIKREGHKASRELAKSRGSFPNFKGSLWHKTGYRRMRNATVTTVAPTGTISVIAGVSSGIEPIFAISFIRDVMEGTKLLEVNQMFEKVALARGFYTKELMRTISRTGSIKGLVVIPEDVRRVFVTALDIAPEWHVKMQAAFQKYTDNAVSKTVNLPKDSTVEDVKQIYLLAHKLKCKGITVYRYASKPDQVLKIEERVSAEAEYAGGCPSAYCVS